MAPALREFQVRLAGSSEQKTDTALEEYAREQNREVLAGLKGVYVLVEGFRTEGEKYGFNRRCTKVHQKEWVEEEICPELCLR